MPMAEPTHRRSIGAFVHVSLDGFYCDERGDMSFAYRAGPDPEWNAFVEANAQGGGALLLGRITYDMMVSWWPTPAAASAMPAVAERMNALPKHVVSRTLESAAWANTTVLKGDLAECVRRLKAGTGPDVTILGSGSIVRQLAVAGLLDTLQLVLNPVVLGSGRSLFGGVEAPLALELTSDRAFRNGCVVLTYVLPGAAEVAAGTASTSALD